MVQSSNSPIYTDILFLNSPEYETFIFGIIAVCVAAAVLKIFCAQQQQNSTLRREICLYFVSVHVLNIISFEHSSFIFGVWGFRGEIIKW